MKKLFSLLLLCMMLTSCDICTLAQDGVYTDVSVSVGAQVINGFEYEYFDYYNKRPVIYIGSVPYWVYWINNSWKYELIPSHYGVYISHYSHPQIWYRPGFRPEPGFRPYKFSDFRQPGRVNFGKPRGNFQIPSRGFQNGMSNGRRPQPNFQIRQQPSGPRPQSGFSIGGQRRR